MQLHTVLNGKGIPAGSLPLIKESFLIRRISVSVAVAALSVLVLWLTLRATGPQNSTDFGQAWFGGRMLLEGRNPYALIGPGLEYDSPWRASYPVTAMILAMPFVAFSVQPAAMMFVFVSTFLLAFVLTRDGWYRLPLFLSPAFLIAVSAAQWSPLITAGFLSPWLAWAFAGKPNHSIAFLASIRSRKSLYVYATSAAVLVLVGFLFLPWWPVRWLQSVGGSSVFMPPIIHFGGPLVLLALLRWRRWEARLIVAMVLTPQTGYWYETLPLLLVAQSYRQSLSLSLISGIGFATQFLAMVLGFDVTGRDVGGLIIMTCYLPTVFLVLRRPNRLETLHKSSIGPVRVSGAV